MACLVAVSCADDNGDEIIGDPYFSIEDDPTTLMASVEGITQKYTVRSNAQWQIVPQDNTNWARAFPDQGDKDGIFSFIVKPNATFGSRTANFAFVVNGEEQPVLFRIEQEANVPYITIVDGDKGIAVPAVGGPLSVKLQTNVEWTYTLSDESWITSVAQNANSLELEAEKNTGPERSTTLTVSSSANGLSQEVVLVQSAGNVILEENFGWLTYGNTIFYTTGGETRMDLWTASELAHGWSSTPNAGSSDQWVVYARPGFVKLGKTGYGGDLISPALAELDGATEVRVTFKAVPYMTAGGTKDDTHLVVGVVGPGTASVSSFDVTNFPDYATDPNCTLIWEDPSSTYSFTVSGATAETQIRFLGGAFELTGVGAGKNRIFLDDIKVEIIN